VWESAQAFHRKEPGMKPETRQRKQTTRVFKALRGQDWLVDRMYQVVQ